MVPNCITWTIALLTVECLYTKIYIYWKKKNKKKQRYPFCFMLSGAEVWLFKVLWQMYSIGYRYRHHIATLCGGKEGGALWNFLRDTLKSFTSQRACLKLHTFIIYKRFMLNTYFVWMSACVAYVCILGHIHWHWVYIICEAKTKHNCKGCFE
jgi:hypothetical protein